MPAQPYLVKPNALEAGELVGLEINLSEDAVEATLFFHRFGVASC